LRYWRGFYDSVTYREILSNLKTADRYFEPTGSLVVSFVRSFVMTVVPYWVIAPAVAGLDRSPKDSAWAV